MAQRTQLSFPFRSACVDRAAISPNSPLHSAPYAVLEGITRPITRTFALYRVDALKVWRAIMNILQRSTQELPYWPTSLLLDVESGWTAWIWWKYSIHSTAEVSSISPVSSPTSLGYIGILESQPSGWLFQCSQEDIRGAHLLSCPQNTHHPRTTSYRTGMLRRTRKLSQLINGMSTVRVPEQSYPAAIRRIRLWICWWWPWHWHRLS